MELNHIQLSPIIVSELYASILVEEKPVSKIVVEKTQNTGNWYFIGENQKNILLLFNNTDQEELNQKQLSLVNNILVACKLGIQDVVVVNLSRNPNANYKNLQGYFKSKTIFLFGIEPTKFGLPINFPQFQVQQFAQCTFLYSPALEELEIDKVAKSRLWVCLRRIFGL